MKAHISCTVIMSFSALLFSQNNQPAPIYTWGSGLDGSTYQKAAIYSDTQYGLLFEAPLNPSNNKLNITFNWRGGGVAPLFIQGSSGNVGIGTTSPVTKLEVNGTLSMVRGNRLQFLESVGGSNRAFIEGDVINQLLFHVGSGTGLDAVLINSSGNVGVGTTTPQARLHLKTPNWLSSLLTLEDTHYSGQAYHFQIESDGLKIKQNTSINYQFKTGGDFIVNNGTIHSKEVKVSLTPGSGPDYVFEPDYKLLSLEEIKNYIDQHKHLPEVPSAKEMETNGVNVSEMNMLLLKKIEELTLHVIELKKRDEAQQREIEGLKNKK